MENKKVLESFTIEDSDIISFIDNKQVTLGLLIKTNGKTGFLSEREYEVVSPLIIFMSSKLRTVKDALTEQRYNYFDYDLTDEGKGKITVNPTPLKISKKFLGCRPDMGVISYSSYYAEELNEKAQEFMKDNNIEKTLLNYSRVLSKLKYDMLCDLVKKHNDQPVRSKKKR